MRGDRQVFEKLLRGCFACGHFLDRPMQAPRECSRCGVPTDFPAPGPIDVTGCHVRVGRAFSRFEGVAVGPASSGRVEVMRADGSVVRVPRRRIRVHRRSTLPGQMRSVAGAWIVLAQDSRLPSQTRQALHAGAVQHANTSPTGARAAALDLAAMGHIHVLDSLRLSPTERIWWTALSRWTHGDHAGGLEAMLALPEDSYPQRLLIWWRAAAQSDISDSLRPQIGAAVAGLAQLAPVCGLAAALVMRELEPGSAQDKAVVTAAARLGEDNPWLGALIGEDPTGEEDLPSRLLKALAGTSDVSETDPAVLDDVPAAVLDELIDADRIPAAWLDRAGELRCGEYLLGRTRITELDDDALARIGAHDERCRRAIAAGQEPAPDVPERVRRRCQRLNAARGGDRDALLELASEAGLPIDQLRACLGDPGRLPSDALLADASIAVRLRAKSTLTSVRWPPGQLTSRQRAYVGWVSLRNAKSLLHSWDWDGALAATRTCLAYAKSEDVRDEALNIMAAVHWQTGRDEDAIKALDVALEGERTPSLQANIGVIAAKLAPQVAAKHLSALVMEAPDLALRVSAARQALLIWGQDPLWTPGAALPGEIARALRSVAIEPVEYEAFKEIVELLAKHDGDWLKRPDALRGSPHADSPAAKIWAGLARGLDVFVRELAATLRAGSEDWVERLRDEILREVVNEISESEGGGVGFAMLVLAEDLPMPPLARIALMQYVVFAATSGIDLETSEPAPVFLEMLEKAAHDATRLPSKHTSEFNAGLARCFAVLARCYLGARQRQLASARERHDAIRAQLRDIPRHLVDWTSVRKAAAPGESVCRSTRELARRLIPHANPTDRAALERLARAAGELEAALAELHI